MRKNKVLIIEDEGIISTDMSISLRKMGYEVISAVPTGEEAIELLDKEMPDVILMDVQLSGELDGIQTAEIINKQYNLPIIYISEHTDELTLSRAKITGPYGYVKKSFNYEELHTTIEMAVYKNEMQNRVVENEYLLNTTLNSIEDAVLNVDNNGVIKFLNTSAAAMFKINQYHADKAVIDKIGFRIVKQNGKEFVHPYKNQRKSRIGKKEYTLINIATGEAIPIECSVNLLFDSNKAVKGYVYLFQNITERKRIADIQSKLASIVESSEDAIIGIDSSGVIRSWNIGAQKIFGYRYDEVMGHNIGVLTPPNIPNELPEIIEKLRLGEAVKVYESVRQTKKGELVEMSIMPSPIRDEKESISGVSIIARNITEKKKLEKEVIEIGEKERERIGRDLHDSLGQHLTGILLNLKAVENSIIEKLNDDEINQLKETSLMIKDAIHQTRALAKNMVPIKLEKEGLPHALEDLANLAETVYKKQVTTSIDKKIKGINVITETQLYHIAQEAINNAVKHADCSKIIITLNIVQSELVLSVKDNGIGFENKKKGGIGTSIMNYRANLISGSLFIHSEKGEGVLVLCRVPLAAMESE